MSLPKQPHYHTQNCGICQAPIYLVIAAAQTCKTFAAIGAATALPEPPFSTNTTNASGQFSSTQKPANIASAVSPSCSAVPDFAQTFSPLNCPSPYIVATLFRRYSVIFAAVSALSARLLISVLAS